MELGGLLHCRLFLPLCFLHYLSFTSLFICISFSLVYFFLSHSFFGSLSISLSPSSCLFIFHCMLRFTLPSCLPPSTRFSFPPPCLTIAVSAILHTARLVCLGSRVVQIAPFGSRLRDIEFHLAKKYFSTRIYLSFPPFSFSRPSALLHPPLHKSAHTFSQWSRWWRKGREEPPPVHDDDSFCRTPHIPGKSLTALLQKERVSAGKWHCMLSN